MKRLLVVVLSGVVSLPFAYARAQGAPTAEQGVNGARLAALRALTPERVVAHSTKGGAVIRAHCAEGYVSRKTLRPSKATVQIVSEQPLSCDGNRCRAVQVVARSEDGTPFDLELALNCAS